jgi:hypothetical protein
MTTPTAIEQAREPTLAEREAAVMQEWWWGNLTPLGVANHLRRAGFKTEVAVQKANALAPSSPLPTLVGELKTAAATSSVRG